MELIIELLVELVVEIVAQCAFDLGLGPIVESRRRGRKANPAIVALGIAFLGGLVGVLLSLLVPQRLLPPSPVPGVSLVVSPIIAGYAMRAFGAWRRAHGHHPSRLATFWGGALFAFSAALVRLLLVGSVR